MSKEDILLKSCQLCNAKFSPVLNNWTSIEKHIVSMAKSEAWQKSIGVIEYTPHLNYYNKQNKMKDKKYTITIDEAVKITGKVNQLFTNT